MPCPSQSSRFNHPDYIKWTVQTMKFLIVEPSPLPILIPLRPKKIFTSGSLPWSFQIIRPDPRPCVTFLNTLVFTVWGCSPHAKPPKLEDHSCSAVHDCLFNIFAANLHIWGPTPLPATQGTRHTAVTGTHGWDLNTYFSLTMNIIQRKWNG